MRTKEKLTTEKMTRPGQLPVPTAFAAVPLAVLRELGLSEDIVNVEGGAIAHGHPIGATGAVLTTRLLHSMRRDGLKRGKGMSVKTNSPVLALGLCWLFHLIGQPSSIYVERRSGTAYYQLNLTSAARVGAKGAQKGLLERILCALACELLCQQSEDDAAVLLVEVLEGRNSHDSFHHLL